MKSSTIALLTIGVLVLGIASVGLGIALANQQDVTPDPSFADELDGSPTPTLTVTPSPSPSPVPAVCGNGAIELGEQCDDGNLDNGDGCNSLCRISTVACTPQVEIINVTIPASPAGSCDWSRGEASGRAKGFNTVSTTLPSQNVCAVDNIVITNSPDVTFRYDDAFVITLNDIVLLGSHRNLYRAFPQEGSFRIFNGVNTLNGVRMTNNNDGSFVECLNSDCQVPISERRGTFTLGTFSEAIQEQIFNRISDDPQISFSTIAIGDDNRSIDCAVPAITLQFAVETVPSECNCPSATSFCGDGVVDPGELCDAGLQTGEPCVAAPGTSCQWCTSQCTLAFEATDATPPPTPTPSPTGVPVLPDTAIFDDTTDTILIGVMVVMAGVWTYVLGVHTYIGKLFTLTAVKVSEAPDKMYRKKMNRKKETLEEAVLDKQKDE